MSYYKADYRDPSRKQLVFKNYLNGIHYQVMNGAPVRTPLGEGATKYNKMLLERTKDIYCRFRYAISVELMYRSLIEKYAPEHTGLTRNIWRVVKAQKGTESLLYVLIGALKKYPVKHQDVYDAISDDLKSCEERCGRNMKFIDEWAKDYGLERLKEAVEKEYGKSLMEYVAEISDAYYGLHPVDSAEDKTQYYKERDAYYVDIVEKFASSHGIDLEADIHEAIKADDERVKAGREEIGMSRNATKMKARKERYEQLNSVDNIRMFKALETGNLHGEIPQHTYGAILDKLKELGGSGCYITVLKKDILYYAGENGKLVRSVTKAEWFPSGEDSTCTRMLDGLHSTSKDAVIGIQHLSIPGHE